MIDRCNRINAGGGVVIVAEALVALSSRWRVAAAEVRGANPMINAQLIFLIHVNGLRCSVYKKVIMVAETTHNRANRPGMTVNVSSRHA